MHVVFSTDRPELPLGEKAGQRDRSHSLLDCFGIVIWLRKQPGSATVTTEEQCRLRWIRVLSPILIEQLSQILIAGFRIAHMKLHRLTDPDQISKGNGSVIGSSPRHI